MSDQDLNQNVSFDDLLDSTLDDLADMPEFKPFAAGAHKVQIFFDPTKKINDLPAVDLKLVCVESVELLNPEDVPPKAGDFTNVAFMLKKKDGEKIVRNELAEGQLKEVLKSLAPAFPDAKTNREIMEQANGFEVLVSTGVRKNDKDKQNIKYYTQLNALSLI
jgi:hypothetical protein